MFLYILKRWYFLGTKIRSNIEGNSTVFQKPKEMNPELIDIKLMNLIFENVLKIVI